MLDQVLHHDRILWLAIFDARLADYSNGLLTLDFLDSSKFPAGHDFARVRNVARIKEVETIAQNVLEMPIRISIK